MLNYPTQSSLGGVFYPQGCVSQLLTVLPGQLPAAETVRSTVLNLVKNSKNKRQ
ncbi:hypothetical protein I8751_24325 [Nostocaceae cyanobacterium CENA357]|uniref:Uncharacterized protein n=2 Tax=Atlanticothrix TaxID=2840441 RepID=A0A8J7HGW2_9CYAN|nr:hypothetical protein [Atlanticothrix silvestris CENA357]